MLPQFFSFCRCREVFGTTRHCSGSGKGSINANLRAFEVCNSSDSFGSRSDYGLPLTGALNVALKLARHKFTNNTTRANQLVKEKEDSKKSATRFRDLNVPVREKLTKLQDVSKRNQLLAGKNADAAKEL